MDPRQLSLLLKCAGIPASFKVEMYCDATFLGARSKMAKSENFGGRNSPVILSVTLAVVISSMMRVAMCRACAMGDSSSQSFNDKKSTSVCRFSASGNFAPQTSACPLLYCTCPKSSLIKMEKKKLIESVTVFLERKFFEREMSAG